MQFDIKQACTYYFKDKKLIQKISVIYGLTLLFFVPLILCYLGDSKLISIGTIWLFLLYPISLAFGIFFMGYFAVNTNRRIMKPDSDLPELNDWKNLFISGGKFFVGNLAWSFIFQIAVTVLILLCAIVIVLLFLTATALLPALLLILKPFALLFFGIVVCAVMIIYLISLFAILLSFYTDLRIESFFDFKKIKMIMCDNFKPLLKLIGWSMVLSLLFGIVFLILIVTIIGIIAIPLLYAFYFLAFCDLQAQLIRYIFKIEQADSNG